HPLHSPFGLRTVGQNQLHPQLLHRPPKLRLRPFARHLFGHAAHPFTAVNAVPVHIQALRQPPPAHPALRYVIAGPRRLLLRELGPDPVGRVIHHHHQHCLGSPPFKPVVVRPVQLHHHPKTLLAFPPLPMPLPPLPHLSRPLGDQPPPQRLMVHHQPLDPQILRRQRRPKIWIPLRVARQHPLTQFQRLAPRAGPSSRPMHQPAIPLRLIPLPHPLGLAIAHPHRRSRGHQLELPAFDLRQHRQPFSFFSTHQYRSFQHLPLFPSGSQRGHFYRVATRLTFPWTAG